MSTSRPDLERAISQFLTNDVTVEEVCKAFAPAELADREALPRLAEVAFGAQTPSDRVVSDLVALVDRWGSFVAQQGIVGTLFVRLGCYEDALRAHVESLPGTPRWHATSAYRALDVIADDLLYLDRFEEAARVAELALRWDPTNPSVLLTLGIAAARAGAPGRGAAIHAYLSACGYPMATWGAALAELSPSAAPAVSYTPDLGAVEALSDDHERRFRACNALHPFIDGEEVRRAHAIACIARGRLDYAVFALREAPEWRAEGSPFDPKIVRTWASAQIAAIEVLPGGPEQVEAVRRGADDLFSSSSIQRSEAIEELAKASDRTGLLGALDDPDRIITMEAARALFKLGDDTPRPLVEVMALAEKELGVESMLAGLTATKLLAWLKKNPGPAPNAKAKKAKKAKGPSRGARLVEQVIDAVRSTGLVVAARPVPPKKLAKLKLPGDKPLSPGLKTFLAFDAGTLGLFADPDAPRFEPLRVEEVAARQFDGVLAALYGGTSEDLPGACLLLGPQDGNRCDVLYVGEADGAGEYPVLTLDCDSGAPDAYISYPGIDVYLASRFDVVEFDPDARKVDDQALDEQRRLNLNGRRTLVEAGEDD